MKNNLKYNILLIGWIVLLSLAELILLFNMITKGTKETYIIFIVSMLLVLLVFIPGILLNIRLKKHDLLNSTKKVFIIILLQAFFAFGAFVGVVEAGLDSKTTTEQVKKVIQFFKGEKKEIYLESFEIVLPENSSSYEIGDVISYNINVTPKKANVTDLIYEMNNEIVRIDTYNKEIECLKNGICNITFYDNHNKDIKYMITIEIYSHIVSEIDLGSNKDLFLDEAEEYQLNPLVYPSDITDYEIEYQSTNPKVALVDKNGKITGVSTGTAKIICKVGDVSESIYVHVNPIREIALSSNTLTIYPGYDLRKSIFIYCDNVEDFNTNYFSWEFDDNLKLDIYRGNKYIEKNYYQISVLNIDYNLTEDLTGELRLKYTYPGGYEIVERVEITLSAGEKLKISDIDQSKTEFEIDYNIYYDDSGLITKYIDVPIYYKSEKNKNLKTIKALSNDNIDLSDSVYNVINIKLNEFNLNKDKYVIDFYPSKDSSEYVTFIINLKYKKVSNYNSEFEMNYLYEETEGKRNEIWYQNLKIDLFNNVTFKNEEFNNSGLVIIPTKETEEILNIEINEYGFVTNIIMKEFVRFDIPKNSTLIFDICSLYEYSKDANCPKQRYIIELTKDYDDLYIKVDDGEYYTEDFEIYIQKGDIITFDYVAKVELEYKGDFQKIINRSIYGKTISNYNCEFLDINKMIGKDYGITEITWFLNNAYVDITHEVKVTIYVTDENGDIPSEIKISVNAESYDDGFNPNGNKYSVGTKLNISINGDSNYKFMSSNENVLKLDDNGYAECLLEGESEIVAIDLNDSEKRYTYKVKVFNKVYDFTLLKGNFEEMSYSDGVYIFVVKTNRTYQFKIDGSNNEEYIYTMNKDINNDSYQLNESGNILISKEGTYTGTIQIGDKDSPYKKTIKFKITAVDDGIGATFKYYIRKLIGHFGYFMALGVLSVIALLIFNVFKTKKYISIIYIGILGVYLAFTTEYIQKTDSTRYYAVSDIKLDSQGYYIGVLIGLVIFGIYFIIKKIIKKES